MKRIKSRNKSLDAYILSKALTARVVGGAMLAQEFKLVCSPMKTDKEKNQFNVINL
ncbi:hypothetical protein AADZ84_17080 [Colwelliaceae bacterium MEBiC 14330]